MSDRLYIGIDSGTQGTKGVVLSEASKGILAEGYHGYGLIENDRGGDNMMAAIGLILLPYFNGERTPPLPSATAHLSGMTALDMNRANICRAAMEGATYGLKYGLDVLRRNSIEPREVRLTGGGAKSALWRQLVADMFKCQVVCLKQEEAGAAGAALQAMWCTGKMEGSVVSLQELTSQFIKLDEPSRCFPDSSTSVRCEELYQRYLALHDALLPLNSGG